MPTSTTLDHVTIVTDDFEASRGVYDCLLGALGLHPDLDFDDPEADAADTGTVAAVGYCGPGGQVLMLLVSGEHGTGGAHFALATADRAVVDAVHTAALTDGISVVQPPREWESDQLGYYGAQFGDGAGNVVEVLYRHR
ncbi:hypothetical protein BH10ACT8_BH10ACT8_12140 [soil metagenome]|jgi:catechol 2,3-dioxygenase-like lactoylglutathione lyase family enzyme